MSKAIDSPRALLCGDREIYFFMVELKNEPGALMQVLSVFASYGINLINLYTTSPTVETDKETVETNLAADFTNKPYSPEQISKSLNLLPVVKETRYFGKQLPNMVVDEVHFPLKLLGERVIIYRETSYTALIHGIRRQLGTAGEALLYHVGYNIGKGSGQRLKTIIEGRLDMLPKYLRYWMLLHNAARLTDIHIDFENKKALIRAEDNYECATGRNYGKPFSQLFRGNLAGILNEVLGIETLVETKCIAAGESYCEFTTPK
ncbi:MAG: hypothetical protein RMI43_03540 [Candidatus Caldarchaeum sp.]|nr:hypothetical protein [Candidatus Caldarchaeum sp.]MDW8063224.1 hypothetical protein [Candidatus Caldarchaeum sp.]MDW8434952.1 hypothetical protein [Candidatus Caldarchaeum sp.]